TRRELIWTVSGAAHAVILTVPGNAQTCLLGTWHVKCPYDGQIDVVEQGTRQHVCSRDHQQVFHDGGVTVVCPNGHENFVKTNECITSFKCRVDQVECNRTPPSPPQRDRGGNK